VRSSGSFTARAYPCRAPSSRGARDRPRPRHVPGVRDGELPRPGLRAPAADRDGPALRPARGAAGRRRARARHRRGAAAAARVALGVLAGVGNVVGLATFFRATDYGSISLAAALGAWGTALPVFYGLAQGESLTALQAGGILLAFTGAVLASQSGESTGIRAAGVGWALVSGLGFGLLLIALPEAAETGTAWALLDARIAVVVLLAAGIAVLRLPMAAPKRELPLLAVPGLLLITGTLMYAEASQRGLLSVVAVLASLRPSSPRRSPSSSTASA
jgi:drug/metabolite transporter (DMT)-like permease